ncbi:MAG: restriction endonuclease subunit S, partial [Opitutales bacterium]
MPEHWEAVQTRRIVEIKKVIAGELGYDIFSITQNGFKVKDITSGEGQLSMDYSKYQIIQVGDLAMNGMDLLTGGVDLATTVGVTSPDYRVFAIRDDSVCHDRFLLYVCRMAYQNKVFHAFGKGSAQLGRWRLPREQFNEFRLPFPPLPEQTAIAAFLDRETAKIDGLVLEQRRLMELLKEKRQAVISHAVTKGLNPEAPMKPSGIEWLGDVPEHWEVVKLKFLCDIQTGDKDTENDVDDGLYPFFVRSQNVERINSMSFDCEAILTAGDGVGVGKVFHYHRGPFDFHQRVYMMNNFRHVHGPFLFHYFKEQFYKVALEGGAKSTVDSLRRPMLTNFPVCVPPEDEQHAIVAEVKDEAEKFDTLTAEAQRAIDLLQERRTA